jgi:polyisoprenoid-binding protein YceI
VRQIVVRLFFVLSLLSFASAVQATPPDHFFNPPENLNPDENYTPGAFPLADVYAARLAYQMRKAELIASQDLAEGAQLLTLGVGEITFSSIKNETGSVLGYFRNYQGVLTTTEAGPEKLEMLIDINSLDTAVPGRNHRILNLFFKSMKPELGTATVQFDSFDLEERTLESWPEGETHQIFAKGNMTLRGMMKPIQLFLNVTRQQTTWLVETAEPISLFMSDFGYGQEIYELMKECNHKSIGNQVNVNVKFYFR